MNKDKDRKTRRHNDKRYKDRKTVPWVLGFLGLFLHFLYIESVRTIGVAFVLLFMFFRSLGIESVRTIGVAIAVAIN